MAEKSRTVKLIFTGDASGATRVTQALSAVILAASKDIQKSIGQVNAFEKLSIGIGASRKKLEELRGEARDVATALIAAGKTDAAAPLAAKYKVLETELKNVESALLRDEAAAKRTSAALAKVGIDTANIAAARSALGASQAKVSQALSVATAGKTLGVRPFAQIKADIDAVNKALVTLRSNGSSPAEMTRAATAARTKIAALRAELSGFQNDAKRSFNLSPAGALAGIVSVAGFKALAGSAITANDELASLQGRLRAFVDDEAEVVAVQEQLFKVAQQTRTPLAANVDLFAKLAVSRGQLKATNAELIEFVRLVGQSLTLGGATPEAASGGLLQLSQALGSARVEAEEFNSLRDSMPIALQIIAKNIREAGGDVSTLTRLVKDGRISNVDLFRGLLNGAAELEEKTDKMQRTVSQSLTQLSNDVKQANKDADLSALIEAIDQLRAIVGAPGFSENIASIGTAIARLAGIAAEGAGEIAVFGDRLGLIAAKVMGSASAVDVLASEISDVDRALKNSFLGKPTKYLFTSDGELKAIRSRLIAERDALLAARDIAPDSSEGRVARVQSLTLKITTLSEAYRFLNADIASGASVKNGRLEADAKQLDGLQKQLATYKGQLAALTGPSAAPKSKASPPSPKRSASGPGKADKGGRKAKESRYTEDATGDGVEQFRRALDAEDAAIKDRQEQSDGAIKARFDLMLDTLRAEGRNVEAEALDTRRNILEKLKAAGVDANSAEGMKLLDLADARAQLEMTEQSASTTIEELQRYSQTLSAAVTAGNLSQAESQRLFKDRLSTVRPEMEANLAKLRELAATLGPDAVRSVDALGTSFEGLEQTSAGALDQLLANWRDVTGQMQQLGANTMQGFADSIADAVVTGNLSFKDLADNIVRELIRIQVQALLTALFTQLVGGGPGGGGFFASLMGGGAGGGGTLQSIGGTYTPTFADGGLVGPVRGPGTGTSDSIVAQVPEGSYVVKAASAGKYRSVGKSLAQAVRPGGSGGGKGKLSRVRLSNGEEVIPPDVVAAVGVPALEAINSGKLDPRSLVTFARGITFAMSGKGVADAMKPRGGKPSAAASRMARFASGGLVGSSSGPRTGPSTVVNIEGDQIDARGADPAGIANLARVLEARDRNLEATIMDKMQRRLI